MSIRTGNGDEGYTKLLFIDRIAKNAPEIGAIGDLDELNAYLGFVKVKTRGQKNKNLIERMQRMVFVISSEISIGPQKKKKNEPILNEKDADWIKSIVYELERNIVLGSSFQLPGGDELSALLDVTRTVARRAERSVFSLFETGRLSNENILAYLNCLSDVLFLMARKKKKNARKARKK